jgi:hypothetical protein
MKESQGSSYKHSRNGEMIKIEIRDATYRLLHRATFNIADKNGILNMIGIIEKYTQFSIASLLKLKASGSGWW